MGLFPKIAAAAAAVAFAVLDCNPSLYIYDRFRDVLNPSPFKSKNVWITGASSGIGEELAYQLSEAGANVVISARREEALERVKAKCLSMNGSTVHVVPLDVTDSKALSSAVDEVVGGHFSDKNGGLDILILNAGKSQRVPGLDTDISTTREVREAVRASHSSRLSTSD